VGRGSARGLHSRNTQKGDDRAVLRVDVLVCSCALAAASAPARRGIERRARTSHSIDIEHRFLRRGHGALHIHQSEATVIGDCNSSYQALLYGRLSSRPGTRPFLIATGSTRPHTDHRQSHGSPRHRRSRPVRTATCARCRPTSCATHAAVSLTPRIRVHRSTPRPRSASILFGRSRWRVARSAGTRRPSDDCVACPTAADS